jgi:hypothetical protein
MAHHAAHGAQLQPARVQLVAGARPGDRVEPADVRALVGDPRQPRVHRLVQGRAEAVAAAPVLVGVAAPDQSCVGLHAVEAGTDEHGEVAAAPRGVGRRRSVVKHRIAVVHLQARLPVREHRVGGRVLAEVLHPAVVAVPDRLVEQPAEEVAAARVGEVDLGDDLVGGERVRQQVGPALRVLYEQPVPRGGVVDRPVARADVRVEVGRDHVSQPVVACRGPALPRLVAPVHAAGQVVRVGLGHRRRHVELAEALGPGILELHPRAEEPPPRVGLAPGVARVTADDVRGPRAGEHGEREPRRLGLGVPGVPAVVQQVEGAALALVDQHAEAARGYQPRDREVRCGRSGREREVRHQPAHLVLVLAASEGPLLGP